MKVGLVYPQVELRGDPQAVHDIGVGAEQLGFDTCWSTTTSSAPSTPPGAAAVGALHRT